jgi:chloride channel protein, CIC family
VLTLKDLQNVRDGASTIAEIQKKSVVTAFPDEPLRLIVYRMAETGLTRMPVVARGGAAKVVGMISLADLLRARTRDLEEERRGERVLRLRHPFGFA